MLDAVVNHLRLEDIDVGRSVSVERIITDDEIDRFAALTGDVSPLHLSDTFARSRGFPARVVHGFLIAGYISQLFGVHLPGRDCLLHSINLKWQRPACTGSRLRFTATVLQISREARTIIAEVVVTEAAEGIILARGKVQFGFTHETQ